MKIEMPLTLDVVTERSPFDYMSVKCGDNESRVLAVSLTCMGKNFEIPEDTSAELRCKKPDGTATLTVGNIAYNKIYIELTQNTLAAPGDALCELQLTKDNEVLTTVNFILRILKNALSDDDIISTNDFTSIKTEILKNFVVDSSMSDTSENSAQNKVVKKYVDESENRVVEEIGRTENRLAEQIGTIDDKTETIGDEVEAIVKQGEKIKNKGVPNGYAPLDEEGKIPVEYIYNNTDPSIYATYGVSIDLSNSNPETSVTYTDGAVGMVGGSADWYEKKIFNKIRPCLFKNGKVVGYLNPNNFAQFVDGSAADISSGDAGDVMIEIPKIGYRILKSGASVSVHITDEPNRAGFSYKAHTRTNEGDRDKLYVGAFLGSVTNSKLYSISGKAPRYNEKIDVFGGYAKTKGWGYDILSFYPLTLLQCLYLIMYKNLNSQAVLGKGYVNGSKVKTTGATIDKGMNYGTADSTEQMKFLGIEDFWGNLNQFIYGCYINNDFHLLVATESFNYNGTGYTDMGKMSVKSSGGYMKEPQGNNDGGFIVYSIGGSSSTYFADYAMLGTNLIPVFGGCYAHGDAAGAFRINMLDPTNSGVYFGARLMFL